MREMLPLQWTNTFFQDLIIFALGGDWGKKPDEELHGLKPVTVLRGTEFKNWHIEKGTTAVPRLVKADSLIKRELLLNDFVIEISGGGPNQPVGRVLYIDETALINAKTPLICSNFCRKIRLTNSIVPKYVYFNLNHQYACGIFDQFQNNSTNIRNLQFNDFCDGVVIPLPPVNEQKRIVAKLDSIIPRIDSLKARIDKIPALIKRFRQSVLTAAVTGKLTEKWRAEHPEVESAEVLLKSSNFKINAEFKVIEEIPDKWCWCALGNYAQLSRGRFSIRPRNDPQYYTGSYPFIQIGDLPKEGGYVNDHKQTLNEKGLKVSKEFEKHTIAIAIVGATIGNTGILSYKMCFPDSLIGIVTQTKDTSLYTEYYLRTEKENFRNIAYSSGGQPNIKLPTLTDYPFPLPPLEEQKEIVRQVDNLFALADKLETHFQNAKARIDKLSQSVLAKAFRGELVPQDPNDEPAEKLLERIMAEKAKMEETLKGAKKKGGRKKAKSGSRK